MIPLTKRWRPNCAGGDFIDGMVLRPDLRSEAGAPSKAACYVDIDRGSVAAHQFPLGGFYTTWTVETDGDPRLDLISRDGRRLAIEIPSTPGEARMSNDVPGSLVLHNSSTNAKDKKHDFVLHYLAREGGIPSSFKRPVPGHEQPHVIQRHVSMTTSCSNSQYP